MEVDFFYGDPAPAKIAAVAVGAEARGYAGLWLPESAHDPFVGEALAATATTRLQIGTAISLALARSPMLTAHSAWDLAACSDGRFMLGLGAAARAVIEGRFSMPWGQTTERMEEYVRALQAIWQAWRASAELGFEGRFTRHTSTDPTYRPDAHDHPIPVLLAAGGPAMIEAAARCADGIVLHPLTTRAMLDDVIAPALERGLRAAGRTRGEMTIVHLAMTVIDDDERRERQLSVVRSRILWYAERRQYEPLLRGAGRPELGHELRALREAGHETEMADLIDDDLVREMAIVATAGELADATHARFGPRVDRIAWLYDWFKGRPEPERRLLARLRGHT
jgi:probable F420-dependent oxidoreductase